MSLRHIVFILITLSLINISCKKKSATAVDTGGNNANSYLHSSGKIIVDGNNQALLLKGIAFGNEVWNDKEIPSTHHNEEDFKRVKDMHMNVIRFYMNYKTFENDNAPYQYKQTGWQWIDQNIAWAKKYGIYLILNMHVPQGGFQSQGNGNALWDVAENQNRLTALWKSIADKYKNEPQIAGFGLVNEPVPTASKQKWQQLAQRITNEIRTVDKNHIIFVEQAIYVKGVNGTDADQNFPLISDENTVYEFHIYNPILYTHQLFTWANIGEGGKYPDENIISAASNTWYTATFNNPGIPAGNSNWQFFEGEKYKINDPKIKLAVPALVGQGVVGKIYFDDIVIKEYGPDGNFVQDISAQQLDDLDGWGYWSSDGTGTNGLSEQTGHSNNKSIFIAGASSDCNVSNYNKIFIPKQNYYYQINGWMKGESVAAAAACRLRIDFLDTNDPVYGRNKQYLESSVKKITDWAAVKNVPLYMGEFGAGIHCFENNKGGLQWVTDMVDIAKASSISFTYHVYHEDSFGLYFGYGSLPDPSKANQPLINLLKLKLGE
jgi:endoglucanase